MKARTIALFVLVSMFPAGSSFATEAIARTAIQTIAVSGVSMSAALLSANTSSETACCCQGQATITFENYTQWNVQCFLNGAYLGTVYPGRTLSFWTGSGWNRPYGRAVFLDGSTLNWDLGDRYYYPGGSYVFPMTR